MNRVRSFFCFCLDLEYDLELFENVFFLFRITDCSQFVIYQQRIYTLTSHL
jgi:hypothetical protein